MSIDYNKYIEKAMRTESIKEKINFDLIDLDNIIQLSIDASELADFAKKKMFYNKKIDSQNVSLIIEKLKETINKLENIDFNKETTDVVQGNYRLLHSILGTYTEAGELMSAIHGHVVKNESFDIVNGREEFGDINWYQAEFLDATNSELQPILDRNIEKLKARYPEKFENDLANNRNLDVERKILEKE